MKAQIRVVATACGVMMSLIAIQLWPAHLESAKAQTILEQIGCESGRIECQVNEIAVCDCKEEWVEDTSSGQQNFLRICQWELVGAWCDDGSAGNIPACTEAYEGAEHVFAGVRKDCFCQGDSCYWRDN